VESENPALLTAFTKAGFYTSYYLPDRKRFGSYYDWTRDIFTHLSQSYVHALSTTDQDYEEGLIGSFPDYDVLLWSPKNPDVLKLDPHVKIILTWTATRFER
jgi:hypothetical protein